jgi:hypothetical protein
MTDQAEIDRYFEREMPGPETRPLFDLATELAHGVSSPHGVEHPVRPALEGEVEESVGRTERQRIEVPVEVRSQTLRTHHADADPQVARQVRDGGEELGQPLRPGEVLSPRRRVEPGEPDFADPPISRRLDPSDDLGNRDARESPAGETAEAVGATARTPLGDDDLLGDGSGTSRGTRRDDREGGRGIGRPGVEQRRKVVLLADRDKRRAAPPRPLHQVRPERNEAPRHDDPRNLAGQELPPTNHPALGRSDDAAGDQDPNVRERRARRELVPPGRKVPGDGGALALVLGAAVRLDVDPHVRPGRTRP